jgi:photosystem II stability/assembly factor-like uncharacterized protein
MQKVIFTLLFFVSLIHIASAQWQYSNGPYGGNVRSIVAEGNSIYADISYSLYYSGDQGNTWKYVKCLESDFQGESTVGACDSVAVVMQSRGPVDFYVDNGYSLQNPLRPVPNYIQKNCLFTKGSKSYISTAEGIYFTPNYDVRWSLLSGTNISTLNNATAISVIVDSIIIVGTPTGLYKSSNTGITWNQVFRDTAAIQSVKKIDVIGGSLFAITNINSMYRSDDRGSHWTLVNSILNNKNPISIAGIGNTLYVGTLLDGVYQSTDNGITWTAINNGLPEKRVQTLVAAGNSIFVGTSEFGIFRYNTNTLTWINKSNGIAQKPIGIVEASGTKIFSANYSKLNNAELDLLFSTNNGSSWIISNTLIPAKRLRVMKAKEVIGQTYLFVGTADTGMLLSIDNGNSWTRINNGLTSSNITSIATSGSDIYIGSTGGIFKSSDNGALWTSISNSIPNNGAPLNIYSIDVNGSTIYTSTSTGFYRSNNPSSTWTGFSVDSGITTGVVKYLNNNLFVLSPNRNKLLRSIDQGLTWAIKSDGFYTGPPSNLPYYFALTSWRNYLFVNFSGGIQVSRNNGDTWESPWDLPTNFSRFNRSTAIGSICFNDTYMYAGVNYANCDEKRGVWRQPLGNINDVKDISFGKINFNISPNPVNNLLHLDCPQELISQKYQIINTLGITVSTGIVTEKTAALSVEHLPKGIYFLKVDGGNTTQKFVKE